MGSYLDLNILEAINFKKLGHLVPEGSARYHKLSAFSQRGDVILTILKRDKMESLGMIIMVTAVTNLTRLDFPRICGDLELVRRLYSLGLPLILVKCIDG